MQGLEVSKGKLGVSLKSKKCDVAGITDKLLGNLMSPTMKIRILGRVTQTTKKRTTFAFKKA